MHLAPDNRLREVMFLTLKYFYQNDKPEIMRDSFGILLFFIDWRYALKYKKHLTCVDWQLTKFGYIDPIRIVMEAEKNEDVFKVTTKWYTTRRIITISLVDLNYKLRLNPRQVDSCLHVLKCINSINRSVLKKLLDMSYPRRKALGRQLDVMSIAADLRLERL